MKGIILKGKLLARRSNGENASRMIRTVLTSKPEKCLSSMVLKGKCAYAASAPLGVVAPRKKLAPEAGCLSAALLIDPVNNFFFRCVTVNRFP
ncbi:hypothetical protein D3C84_886130 [compost metagenome]